MERWVADEPQPGLVEVSMVDAHGKRWTFIDKTAIFTAETITARSGFPRDTLIGCEELGRRIEQDGREIATISTAQPWSVETVDEVSEFEVERRSLVDDSPS